MASLLIFQASSYGDEREMPERKGSLKLSSDGYRGIRYGEHSSEQAHAACCKSSEDQESANRLSSGMAMVFRSD